MGVRETINRQKAIGIASAMMIVVCLAFAVKQYQHGGRPSLPHFADKAYYTTDDGATFFTDSVNLIPPFDHLGRSRAGAYVHV